MASTKLHILTSQSPDLEFTLPGIIAFSNAIFSADPTTKYGSLSYWKERLSHPSSVIIYLTPTDTGDPEEDITSVGFLFAHPRTHTPPLEAGQAETLHIWLAGVSPKWRNGGCLAKMVDAIPAGNGFELLTVCTTPGKFPDMWKWLQKRGWKVERDMGEGKVLLSKPVTV